MSTNGPNALTDQIYRDSLDPARLALIVGDPAGQFPGIPYAWLTNPGYKGYSKDSQAAGDSMLRKAQLTGLPIDYQTMIDGWSAPMVMLIRENNHYPYVPPYGAANINIAPGLSYPFAESNYPASMPAGWIKVSTDAADYPTWASQHVPPPPAPVVWMPDFSVTLSWTDQPHFDPAVGTIVTGKTMYFFGIRPGQSPNIGQTCKVGVSSFTCSYYPNPEAIGGPVKMWLLTA